MLSRLPNYLRTYRKRSGLSRSDVAFLLGSEYPCFISKYELSKRTPSIENVFAFEAMFGVSARELLPGKYTKVEKKIEERARLLATRYQSAPGRDGQYKIKMLEKIIKRGEDGPFANI